MKTRLQKLEKLVGLKSKEIFRIVNNQSYIENGEIKIPIGTAYDSEDFYDLLLEVLNRGTK